MRSTGLAIGAVAVGIAIMVGWWLWRAAELARENIVEITLAAPDPAAVDPTRLRPSAEVPANSVATVLMDAATSGGPNVAPVPLPDATLATPLAQIFEARRAQLPPMFAQREREFAAQSVDRTWATSAASEILDRFAQANSVAFNTLHVECKSTMCRLEAVSPKLPGATAPQFNMVGNSMGLKEGITISDTAGTLYTVAYVWRDGMAPAPVRRPPPQAN